ILEAYGGYEHGSSVSPPSMVVNAAGTHLAIERADAFYAIGGHSGTWHWNLLYGFKATGQTAYTWTVLDSTSGSWGGWPSESPSICIDSKGGIHVAWDYEGEIYWRVYDSSTNAWKNKVNLSYSPDVVSAEPSLAFYGDVHIVWQEGNDIYHNKGNWGLPLAVKSKIIGTRFSWQGSENVNPNSSGTASLNPVFDGNYIAWNEATDDGLYKASYANYADFAWVVETDYSKNPTQPSVYPQIAYRQNADGNKMTTVWTEGTGPLYSLIARDSAGQVTAELAADVGGTEPSIYTIERDGYLTYSAGKSKTSVITVDYDSTELLYYLPTLDREQKQTVKISLYQEYSDKADYIYQVWVDNVSLGAVKVPTGQMVTFEKDLPNAVSHDGEGVLKIVNLKKGAIVTCDNWQLFAYDKATGRKNDNGGAQTNMSEARPVAYRYELMQNAPNPSSKNTMINYQLAKQGQVSLKVYNTLGQVVKTLVNESQNPGPYSVKWNGKDESGRQAAAGIYFYRLASGEFNSTKKMVVLR
ncbi:MAG: FlgD immunoglobulin-like domain containing protein, partial [bacterium]|nr:FlgD immunoglobulin-like domain containing protein [bacterium]